MPFNTNLQWLKNGEQVTGTSIPDLSSGVLNRPLYQLLQNDLWLKEQTDTIPQKAFSINASLSSGLNLVINEGVITGGSEFVVVPQCTVACPNNDTVLICVETSAYSTQVIPGYQLANDRYFVVPMSTLGSIAQYVGDLLRGQSCQVLYKVTTINNTITEIVDLRQSIRSYQATGIQKNKLINGDFSVWQRWPDVDSPITVNTTLFPDFLAPTPDFGVYVGPDRWKFGTSHNAVEIEVTRRKFDSYGQPQLAVPNGTYDSRPLDYLEIKIVSAGPAGSKVYLSQSIELVQGILVGSRGRTFSTIVKSPDALTTDTVALEILSYDGTTQYLYGSKTASMTSDWESHYCTLDPTIGVQTLADTLTMFYGPNSVIAPRISIPADQLLTYHVTISQFEEGMFPTKFEERPAQYELSLCERYFEKSYDIEYPPGFDCGFDLNTCLPLTPVGLVIGLDTSNDDLSSCISQNTRFRTRKRSIPTITWYDTFGTPGQITVLLDNNPGRVVTGTYMTSESNTGVPTIFVDENNPTSNTLTSFAHFTADSEII